MPTTAEQQLFLEFINRARADPEGEYHELISGGVGITTEIQAALDFFNVDLPTLLSQLQGYDPVAPVAWSDILATSAQTHNDVMNAEDAQGHFLTDTGDAVPGYWNELGPRFEAAGYDNYLSISENVYAFAYDEIYAHAGFVIDWGFGPGGIQNPAGHRDAILNGTFTEVGIAYDSSDSGNSIGPFVTTQHFGTTADYQPQLLGVIFDDADDDDFYDIGEGMGSITITAEGAAGTFVTTSWASGGYQMVLPDGVYTVTFSGDGLDGVITTTVTIDGENVKADAIADEAVEFEEPAEPCGRNIDHLVAGPVGDMVRGTESDDTLDGGDGDDVLIGGAGADVFIFDTGDGADVIVDFDASIDEIELSAALTNGQTAQDIASSAYLTDDGDMMLFFDHGDQITLKDFTDTAALADALEIV